MEAIYDSIAGARTDAIHNLEECVLLGPGGMSQPSWGPWARTLSLASLYSGKVLARCAWPDVCRGKRTSLSEMITRFPWSDFKSQANNQKLQSLERSNTIYMRWDRRGCRDHVDFVQPVKRR